MGNAQFEGFSVDLIAAIAKECNFKYEIYLVADNQYGNYDKDKKEWNGIVRELLDRVSVFFYMILVCICTFMDYFLIDLSTLFFFLESRFGPL